MHTRSAARQKEEQEEKWRAAYMLLRAEFSKKSRYDMHDGTQTNLGTILSTDNSQDGLGVVRDIIATKLNDKDLMRLMLVSKNTLVGVLDELGRRLIVAENAYRTKEEEVNAVSDDAMASADDKIMACADQQVVQHYGLLMWSSDIFCYNWKRTR